MLSDIKGVRSIWLFDLQRTSYNIIGEGESDLEYKELRIKSVIKF